MSEYQAALADGTISSQKTTDASMQQMAESAKQFANGAKDFFQNRVAPAAAGAAHSVQSAIHEQAARTDT